MIKIGNKIRFGSGTCPPKFGGIVSEPVDDAVVRISGVSVDRLKVVVVVTSRNVVVWLNTSVESVVIGSEL